MLFFLPLIIAISTYFIGKKFYQKVDNRWILLIISVALIIKALVYIGLNFTIHFNSIEKVATLEYLVFHSPAILSVLFANAALYFGQVKLNKKAKISCLGLMLFFGIVWVIQGTVFFLIGNFE